MHISRSSFIRATALAAVFVGTQLALSGCAVSVPRGVDPVSHFDINRYLGTWYELARIDHHFEKNLIQVAARYQLNADGSISVLNRGFDARKQEWREAEGKAQFLGPSNVAALKVSFFGPFYGGYNVVSLDDEYQTSLVIGGSLDYFWLLSRQKSIPEEQLHLLLLKAKSFGVDLSRVIRVPQ